MIRHSVSAFVSVICTVATAHAESPGDSQPASSQRSPFAIRASLQPAKPARPSSAQHSTPGIRELVGGDRPALLEPDEHPLMPALRWAKQTLPAIEHIQDYSATLVARQRVGDKLGKRHAYFIKVRHRPFSIYTCGLGPAAIKGEEAIYVEGQNDGKIWAHPGGISSLIPTMSLDPKGVVAMRDQRYPMTEIGILSMLRHMIAIAEQDCRHEPCEVRYFTGGKINGRACSWCQVVHPQRQRYFQFHVARIFVDDELKIPVRYEAYSWPSVPGGQPELLEEYSYLDLKLDNGFTDADFNIANPAYRFR